MTGPKMEHEEEQGSDTESKKSVFLEQEDRNFLISRAVNKILNGGSISEALTSFTSEDQHDVALKLIEAGQGYTVAAHLSNFQGLDHNEIALKIIEAGQGYTVVLHPENFHGLELNKEIALKIIEKGGGLYVVQRLDKFQGLDHDVALKLIETGQGSAVFENFDKFQGLDYKEVALKLIEKGFCNSVAENLDKFQGLDHDVALKLIEEDWGGLVVTNLDKFQGLDYKEVALKLIEKGFCDSVAVYLDKFQGDIFERARPSDNGIMLRPGEYLAIYLKENLVSEKKNSEGATLDALPAEEFYRAIMDKLIETNAWTDQEIIIDPFRAGAEIFGYEKMFRYLNCEGLTRHDGLHAFNSIIALYNKSGLSADVFYAKILDQVARDGGTYESGTAHHELNQVATSFNGDIAGNLERAQTYSAIPQLRRLAEVFSSPAEVFASWKNLRKYNELTQLLGGTELLERLAAEPDEKLRSYVVELAFHPEGNVDMQKAMEFWHDPRAFLDLPDSHTPEEVHNRKKPSNLADIPNLDLTPEGLRDALVDGSLDRIQAFVPMKVDYEIGYSLRKQIWDAVGNYQEKIKGSAADPKKLFSEIAGILKAEKITVQQYLAGTLASPEAEAQIRIALGNQKFGVPTSVSKKFPSYRVIMRTNAKSDPQGVLAGNDTACCMPFGSGKNNVYTWNPACTLATLEIERPDGSRRTIAQSVLTKDRDIGKNVADVVAQLRSEGESHLQDVLSEDILNASPAVIACDNIEVAPNYRTEDFEALIKTAYQDFFREYLARYGKTQGFADDRVVIGMGFSDAMTDLPRVPNTTIPEAPVGYSDKMHSECYELSMKSDVNAKLSVTKKTVTAPQEAPAPAQEKGKRAVSPLTFEDTMATAYIEGKAYAGNQSLMEYMWKIENTLIAKDINNAAKERPNMSFKYESDGKMRGYLVAYEGKLGVNEEGGDEDMEGVAMGEPVIYISDLAVAEPGTMGGARAGASLVGSFVEQYGNEYLKKGNFTPIFAYAREQTSYKLIQKELERYQKELGVEFVLEEGESYAAGEDTMHPVMIRPKRRE